jgi:isopenicillin N synthase-like dioxygenase
MRPEAPEDTSMRSEPILRVPVVDLDDYISCDTTGRVEIVDTLGDGLRELGFLVVEGHGIDPALIRRSYELWQSFFTLDETAKRQYSGVAGGARGFTPFGVEHAKDNPTRDLKEFWHVGQELAPEDSARLGYAPNVWPREVPELREPTVALFQALERVAEMLLRALAEYFDLPRDTFAAMMRQGNSILRVLHYPPVPAGADPAVRAAAHEDINLITLLCEATDSGLQLLTRDGAWLPVEAGPGQIVVDAGDMLSRVTNEVVPATTHRVVNPAGGVNRDRFSMPFFVHPYSACDLSVNPRFVSHERPPKYPPITAGAFLEERLAEIGLKK